MAGSAAYDGMPWGEYEDGAKELRQKEMATAGPRARSGPTRGTR